MMADPQTLIAYWQHGQQIVERCLEKAQQANPADAPMPLVGAEAALWHRAQMEAYRHCLEMMGYPTERSEEHTSELQSLMRISYAVFCLKQKINTKNTLTIYTTP